MLISCILHTQVRTIDLYQVTAQMVQAVTVGQHFGAPREFPGADRHLASLGLVANTIDPISRCPSTKPGHMLCDSIALVASSAKDLTSIRWREVQHRIAGGAICQCCRKFHHKTIGTCQDVDDRKRSTNFSVVVKQRYERTVFDVQLLWCQLTFIACCFVCT